MSKWFKSDARYVRRSDMGAGPDESWQLQTGVTTTPNSGAGTFTTTMYYKRIGSTVFVRINIFCNAVGTSAGSVAIDVAPLPYDVNQTGGQTAGCGINTNSGVAMSVLSISATILRMLQYNAGVFPATGVGWAISFNYETTELP